MHFQKNRNFINNLTMYAIVDIAGQQFKVEKDQEIFVHRLEDKEGSKVKFDEVLLLDNDGQISVGTPYVNGMSVSATVLSHEKGDKVTIFKKKRRKSYQKENGHRQQFSKIKIEEIGKVTAAKKAEVAKEAEPKAEKAVEKPEAAEAKKTAPKKVAEKKETTAKKAAPKKAAPKKKAEDKKEE